MYERRSLSDQRSCHFVSALYQDEPDVKKYFGTAEKPFFICKQPWLKGRSTPSTPSVGWIINGRTTSPVSECGNCFGSGVFFLTQERVVSLADFAPTPLPLRRRRQKRCPRTPITKNIVYTYVFMIELRWPAPAVVQSDFAGLLVVW